MVVVVELVAVLYVLVWLGVVFFGRRGGRVGAIFDWLSTSRYFLLVWPSLALQLAALPLAQAM